MAIVFERKQILVKYFSWILNLNSDSLFSFEATLNFKASDDGEQILLTNESFAY